MSQELEKIHSIEKNILIVFDELCKKYNLEYFICGGTLLGAIRHKGFIPWDDDVDVMMPRKDWEKFRDIQEELPSNLSIMNTEIMHLFNNQTEIHFDHILGDRKKYGVMVDIFPIDGQPSNKWSLKMHQKKVLFFQMFIRFSNFNNINVSKNRTFLDNSLMRCGKILKLNKILDKKKWVKRIHKELSKYDYYKEENVGALLGSFREKEVMPKNIFGKGKYVEFSGMNLKAPNNPEEYLTRLYGDYMKLPPVSERGEHHTMRIYKL